MEGYPPPPSLKQMRYRAKGAAKLFRQLSLNYFLSRLFSYYKIILIFWAIIEDYSCLVLIL
jgi:hypothetical protein